MNYQEQIGKILKIRSFKISTVESCTGGLLSSKLTDVSGSSDYVTLNLVTYSNDAKKSMLSVQDDVIEKQGAVSEECAYQMARGLYNLTKSEICVSTTGIAGPTGGSVEKPVGLMYSCIYTPDRYKVFKIIMPSNTPRIKMKKLFAQEVLKNILEFIQDY